MASSLIQFWSTANPGVAAVDRFAGPWLAVASNDLSEVFIQMPFAATLRQFYVCSTGSGYSGAGSTTFTVRVNGVDTALGCVIADGTSPYVGTDLTNTVNTIAGDRVSVRWTRSVGATSSGGFLTFSLEVVPASGLRQVISFAASGASPSTSNRFLFPYAGATSAAGTTELFMIVPTAGNLRNLRVRALTAPTGAGTITYTVRVNGVSTALNCTVSHSTSPHEGSDTSNTVAVAAHDRISLLVVHSSTPTTNGAAFLVSLEFEQP
jgi:hypothetical protein